MLGAAALLDVGGRRYGDPAEWLADPHADNVARDGLAQPDAGIASLRDDIDEAFFMMKFKLDERMAQSERRDDLWQKVAQTARAVFVAFAERHDLLAPEIGSFVAHSSKRNSDPHIR